MGYKFLDLEDARASGRWSESGVSAPKAYKGHKNCAHCEKEFIVDQLKRGREPKYCSPRCRLSAYRRRHEFDEKHPLRETPGLKGVTDERYLKQINELKEQVKAQAEELKEAQKAQKVANDIILKKITALTKSTKETSLQTQKTTNITAKEVATDIATSATGALIAEKVREFFTKWENKPVTNGDLELLEKQVHHWFWEVQKNIKMEVQTVLNQIKEQQKKALFH